MLARAVPDLPCSVLLDLEEWQALYCAIHQCPTPPEEPPSLGQAVRWIAQLAALLDGAAVTSRGPKRCGGAFNT